MPRPRGGAPRVHACTFRIRILESTLARDVEGTDVWREIELLGDQTLADLGEEIAPAFGFDDDHLWSFFLGGQPWDASTEYTRDVEGHGRLADRLRIRDAPAGKEFLFLFDYGDEWHFGVRLARTAEVEPGADYPRVVASHGEAPPQYEDLEDDWDEAAWDEDDEAAQERERLGQRFEIWAGQRNLSADTWLAPALLGYKAEADGELTRWTATDLRKFLLEWCPHMLAVPEEQVAGMVPSVRAFVLFLDDTGLLDPDGDGHGALDATLDWIAPQLEAAMADVSRFSAAKTAFSAMQAQGVDLEDARAVDRFLADFLLPPEVQLPGEEPGAGPTFPPVVLASRDELRRDAAAAPAMRRLVALVGWVGEGRKVTAKGDPLGDDGGFTLAWAKQLGLVRTHGGRLVRVKQRQDLLDDPFELFNRAFDALPALSAELLPTGLMESAFAGGLPEAIVDLLSALYGADEPVAAEDLIGHIWDDHVLDLLRRAGASDGEVEVLQATSQTEVGRLLRHLEEMGALERDLDGTVRLTPLGVWRGNILLRAAGASAPVIGELTDADVDTLITGVIGYDEEACRAELRAWCERHGAVAARMLGVYARGTPQFERQMLALVGLEEAGPAAEVEVREMLDDEALRPQAQMWLVRNGYEDRASLDPAAPTLLMAETLATILQVDGPATLVEQVEELGPPEEQIAMVESLWRAPNPRVVDVLDAIGKAHPVPEVSKSARKAALKLRSSGAER
jgi:Plasmid pRiA4b ORF-3-like protein